MRNELSTVIKKTIGGLGEGLLEAALAREGAKGCGSILCAAPVDLEPPYEPFDSLTILGQRESTWEDPPAADIAWATSKVFAAPEDILSLPWMETLFRAWSPFGGPFAFELIGTRGTVGVHLSAPKAQDPGVRKVMSGLFPGLRLQEVPRPFSERDASLELAVEEVIAVPPYHRTLSLIGKEGASPLGPAYQALSGLDAGQLGVYQVIFKPTSPEHEWHFNIQCLVEAERRAAELHYLGGLSPEFSYDHELPSRLDASAKEKVAKDCATYAVICRYGVWAPPEQAQVFFEVMRGAVSVLRFGNHPWRWITNEAFQSCLGAENVLRMVVRRRAHRPGLVVTSDELASHVHLPNAWALEMFECVERRQGHELREPAQEVASGGDVLLGVNVYAGRQAPVVQPCEVRLCHTRIVGTTGVGKSHLMLVMILSDAASGQGVIVIDPHGDLSDDVLSRLPEDRLKDLVYVTFTERGLMPKWNPFAAKVPPGKFADDFTRALVASGEYLGPQMGHVIRNAAYTVHVLGGCLDDFSAMLLRTDRGEALIREAMQVVQNPHVRRFWTHEFPTYGRSQIQSTLNKPSKLTTNDALAAMFGQRENDLDPREWMDTRKVVVVNLASGILGIDEAKFIGGLLCSLIHRAALSRADIDKSDRLPCFLYLDETQDLQSGALTQMLTEARKYKLGTVMAHQHLSQLEPSLAEAIGNCSTEIVFPPTEGDGPQLRRVLHGRVTERELADLKPRNALVAIGNRVVSLATTACPYPVVRSGRALARQTAERTYMRLGQEQFPKSAPVVTRREREYDSVREKEDTP